MIKVFFADLTRRQTILYTIIVADPLFLVETFRFITNITIIIIFKNPLML